MNFYEIRSVFRVFFCDSRSASSVMAAVKALLDKDFITQEGDTYFVYDQFFALWLLRSC